MSQNVKKLEHILNYYCQATTDSELENAVIVFNATASDLLTNHQITSQDFERYFEKESAIYSQALSRLYNAKKLHYYR